MPALGYLVLVTIDHESGGPVWMQLAVILRTELEAMSSGRVLPSVRTLMQSYEVSDGTVKRALKQLRAEGLIVTYQGRGSFKA